MPKVIQTRKGVEADGDEYENDVSGSEYQENDYLIAARTGLFNPIARICQRFDSAEILSVPAQ